MDKLLNKLKSNELIYGSIINFSIKILSFLLTYFMMFLMIRNYGIDDYGKYNLYLLYIGVVSMVIVFGTDIIFLKEISVQHGNSQRKKIFSDIMKIFIINIIIVTPLFLISNTISFIKEYFLSNQINIYILLVLSIFTAFIAVFVSGLRGTGKILIYSISERFLLRFITALLLTLSTLFFIEIEYVLIVSHFVTLLIIGYFFKKFVLNGVNSFKLEKDNGLGIFTIYKQARYIFVSSLLILIISRTDTFFLSIYFDLETVGLYGVLLQLSLLINFGMSSINGILSPIISREYTSNNFKKLEKTLNLANKIIIGSSIIAGIILIVLIEPLFSILNLETSDIIIKSFVILVIGQVISGSMGSIVNLLNMSGNYIYVTKSTMISFVITLISCFLLIPSFGILGAAIGTTIGLITRDVMSTYYSFKIFKFKFSIYDKRKQVG